MKKILIFITAIAMVAGMTACGNDISDSQSGNINSNNVKTEASTTKNEEIAIQSEITESYETTIIEKSEFVAESAKESKILICYFSFPETDSADASSGASRVVIDGETKGAMQYMAEIIADSTGGDLFRIETVQQYPGTHEPLVDQAADEKAESARPELSTHIENLDDYNTIFIGYPNWWGDMPMPLYTFLEEYDFSGKTIIPFNSHGGSRFSNTIETIASYEPDAEVITDGFTVSRDDVDNVKSDLTEWVHELGY